MDVTKERHQNWFLHSSLAGNSILSGHTGVVAWNTIATLHVLAAAYNMHVHMTFAGKRRKSVSRSVSQAVSQSLLQLWTLYIPLHNLFLSSQNCRSYLRSHACHNCDCALRMTDMLSTDRTISDSLHKPLCRHLRHP